MLPNIRLFLPRFSSCFASQTCLHICATMMIVDVYNWKWKNGKWCWNSCGSSEAVLVMVSPMNNLRHYLTELCLYTFVTWSQHGLFLQCRFVLCVQSYKHALQLALNPTRSYTPQRNQATACFLQTLVKLQPALPRESRITTVWILSIEHSQHPPDNRQITACILQMRVKL